MKKILDSPLGKIVLEALRWSVLGAVSLFVSKLVELLPSIQLDPNFVIVLTAILRFIDAALHKSGAVEKGITRF